MNHQLPLLRGHRARDPVAWRGGQAVPAAQFVADVQAFAAGLPAQAACVNLCTDRYAFAVAFGAALLRGRRSLLPPNARPETLAALRAAHGPMFAATDDPALRLPGLEVLCVPEPVPATALASAPAPSVPAVPAALEAVCLLTSGSTGQPQPHAKTWGMLHANTEGGVQRLCELLGRPALAGLTLVATVPPQHSYGFESSLLLALLGGAAFHAGRPFYPADIAAALAEVPRPRALVTTPFHLKALLAAGIELPPCDLVLSATAPLSPQLAREAEARFGGALIEIYGCTEAGQVATRRSAETEVWTTFGELRIRHEPAPAHGTGEGGSERFVVQGGHVLEPTPLADLLKLEDARHFYLLGRANDLVHVAGRRSSLGHLNYHLNSIEGVQDGAFWLPDEVPDDVVRPVAFVVAPELSREAIVAALRKRLEAPFVPRRVVHVAELPREATGKLTREALRRFAQAQLALAGS